MGGGEQAYSFGNTLLPSTFQGILSILALQCFEFSIQTLLYSMASWEKNSLSK